MEHRQTLWNTVWNQIDGWTLAVGIIALLMISPVLVVLSGIFVDSSEVWSHLATTVLPQYIKNSLMLMVGVGCGVLVLGVSTAWLVSTCQFPGRSWFEWLLLLPLAAPAYLLAYVLYRCAGLLWSGADYPAQHVRLGTSHRLLVSQYSLHWWGHSVI